MAAKDTLKIIAPELATLPDEVLDFWIAQAELSISSALYQGQREYAVALKAADMITTSKKGADVGAVKSKKEGDLQIDYETGSAATSSKTSYGLLLEELTKQYAFLMGSAFSGI